MKTTWIEKIDALLPYIGLALGYALLFAMLGLTGCARFSTNQKDLSYDPKTGERREITTRATASTFFAAKSSLATWKATQSDKSQGASVGNLSQEANATTNLASIAEAIAAGVARGVSK